MEKLRKLFGQYNMTWVRLIVFSIICGVYTAAVLLIPGVKDSALKEIGVGYECWFLLAIFVVSNCKNGKDAALKCFIFFLISQPLVYLVQMIFIDRNLLLDYYKPWLIKTFFTLPGGFIAYQIKRNDWLASVVLSVAGTFVSFMGALFFIESFRTRGISYTLYGLFLVVSAVLLGFIFCQNKKYRRLYLIIIIVITLVLCAWYLSNHGAQGRYEMDLSKDNWYLASCYFHNLNADIDDDVLIITYTGNNASGELTLQNDAGGEQHLQVEIKKGQVTITKLD